MRSRSFADGDSYLDRMLVDAPVDHVCRHVEVDRTGPPEQRSLYAQVEMSQKEAYSYAGAVMAAGVTSHDGQKGIASFMEKRRPEWKNR